MARFAVIQLLKIGGLGLGLVGLLMLVLLPPLGIVALILGVLFFLAGVRTDQRQKARDQAALEERRHQELLAATRGTAQGAPKANEPESIGKRLGSL